MDSREKKSEGPTGVFPIFAWKTGNCLQVSAISTTDATGETMRAESLATPGDFAMSCGIHHWVFRLGLPPGIDLTSRLILPGFDGAWTEGSNQRRAMVIMAGKGVLIGECPATCQPELICEEAGVQLTATGQWLMFDNYRVLLQLHEGTGIKRLCLVVGTTGEAELIARAQRHFEDDVAAMWNVEWNRRERFLEKFAGTPAASAQAAEASECLHENIRFPQGEFSTLWIASTIDRHLFCDLNNTGPIAEAWSAIDANVGFQLILGALKTQGDDGTMVAKLEPTGRALDESPPLPIFATVARRCWQATKDSRLLTDLVPLLNSYIHWSISCFDPRDEGRARWPSYNPTWHADASAFEASAPSPQLNAMLALEIEAYLYLSSQLPAGAQDTTNLKLAMARYSEASIADDLTTATLTRFQQYAVGQVVTGTSPEFQTPPADPVSAALWIISHLARASTPEHVHAASIVALRLDRHRMAIAVTICIIVGIGLLATIGYGLRHGSMTKQGVDAVGGLARQNYGTGQFEDALALYRQLKSMGPIDYPVDFEMGKTLFKLGRMAEAESCFRAATELDASSPSPIWDLAVTLFAQSKLAESSNIYAQIEETFGAAYPEMARRAATARNLIGTQLAVRNQRATGP